MLDNKTKEIFYEGLTRCSEQDLKALRTELCRQYNPEDFDLCMKLDEYVEMVDDRIRVIAINR